MATYSAGSAERSAVAAALAFCAAGDKLIVPAGAATWTTALTPTVGIDMEGAGIGATVITNGGSGRLITYEPADYSLNSAFRLHGFEFDANGAGVLQLGPDTKRTPFVQQTNVRIDNNKFKNGSATSIKGQHIMFKGTMWGVTDNNTFEGSGYPISFSCASYLDEWWDAAAQNINDPGGADAMYVEDNTFTLTAYNTGDNVLSDGEYSHRYVFRYNTITNATNTYSLFDSHGEQSEMASGFRVELYGNQVSHGAYVMDFLKHRSGISLAMLNNATTSETPHLVTYAGATAICPTTHIAAKRQKGWWWGNRVNLTGAKWHSEGTAEGQDGIDCDGLTAIPLLGREVFADNIAGAPSSPGVSSGPLASRPSSCTTGQGYFATDQSVDDLTGMVGKNPDTPISGTLYVAVATNTWAVKWTPYTYPHPLRGEGTGNKLVMVVR
jgi:hypothetical protein